MIAQPPWTALGKKIESLCRKALYEFEMLERGPKIAVALSGGKDSVTLLYMLKAISGRGFPPFELYGIHVTGEFSCGAGVSLGFLKEICDQLEVPLIVCSSTQKREGLQCYSCSRERRRLIFDAAKEVGALTIAFGHHKDDNVQTTLMNLLHKAEFSGNLAKVPMHDYGVLLIRPLIYVAEEEVIEFAKKYGFARITCQCPVGQDSVRKKTAELLKEIEYLFPNARDNIAQAVMEYGSDKASRR